MKYDALFTDAEQRYGLPPGVLRATARIESSGRANARSGQADGLMQFTPATAKSYGVNPFDPASAVDGAGRLWRDNLKLAGGDIDTAAKLYHAGPDRSGWGPKTEAYPVKLRAAMGVSAPNPFAELVNGENAKPNGGNPFAEMVAGGETAPRGTPAPVSQRPANAPAPTAMGPDAGGMVAPSVPVRDWSAGTSVSGGAAGSGAGGRGLAIPANAGGVAAGSPSPVAPGQLNGGGTNSLSDILLGGAQGLQNVKQGLFGLGARGVDAVFGTDISKRNAAQQAEGKAATGRMASSPDSPTLAAGELLGEVAGTAPLSAVAPLARIGKGGKLLSRVLTGGADLALQGGIAGGVLADPSQSLTKQIALGAALGGGLGAAAPVAGEGFAKALARAPKAAAIAAPTDDAIAGAIATGGARRGLMGNAMLPDDVRAQVNALVQQGVPLDQAIREAQAVAIGAKPHTGTVTRNPQDLAAALEGAKSNTPEGLALNQQLAGNNAAAHGAIASKVDALGGVPAHGEAMNEAAAVMAKAKDAEKQRVAKLYEAAALEHPVEAPQAVEPNINAPQPDVPAEAGFKRFETPDEYATLGKAYTTTSAAGGKFKRRGPMDLVTWLRSNGGVADQGGDLAFSGIDNAARDMDFARNENFFGKLVHDDGMNLDDAALSAWENGFFPEHTERPTVNDLLDAIEETHTGRNRRFSLDDQEQFDRFMDTKIERHNLDHESDKIEEELKAAPPENTPASFADHEANQPPLESYMADTERYGGTVSIKPLLAAFEDIDLKAPATAEGKAFASGIKKAANLLSKNGTRGLAPAELERLRQIANGATGMDRTTNRLVGIVKGKIDALFDELGNASPAYKAARKAHSEWAQKWEAPGVEDLTRRDVRGQFVNTGEKTGVALVKSSDPRALENIVARLKEHGPDELNKLKASVIQDAYEAVTKGAHDSSGHAALNGRRFLQELDKLGPRKLDALFTPKEQGELAAFGRGSMDLNDVQPGTFNASGTSAALLNALRDASGAANKGATGKGAAIAAALSSGGAFAGSAIGGPVGTVIGAALGGGAKYGIDALARRGGEKALARTINEIATPETARAASAKRAQAMARAIQSAKVAGVINRGTVPAVVATQGQR